MFYFISIFMWYPIKDFENYLYKINSDYTVEVKNKKTGKLIKCVQKSNCKTFAVRNSYGSVHVADHHIVYKHFVNPDFYGSLIKKDGNINNNHPDNLLVRNKRVPKHKVINENLPNEIIYLKEFKIYKVIFEYLDSEFYFGDYNLKTAQEVYEKVKFFIQEIKPSSAELDYFRRLLIVKYLKD